MEGIFKEFENENSLRAYPFAAGCVKSEDEVLSIPADVFVDAALYPINPVGDLYLSSISETGEFSVSDDNGVMMRGTQDGSRVELHDVSAFSRHVGTLVASSEEALFEFSNRGVAREFTKGISTFASSCIFPVVMDGVLSIEVGGTGPVTGMTGFSNGRDDEVRVSSTMRSDGRKTLRFDVLPRPGVAVNNSIKRVICVVDGRTPFRIKKSDLSYNTVLLTLENVDKGTVCTAAHREDQFEIADTCECNPKRSDPDEIPEVYQLEEVYIPPDPDGANGGVADGSENAFYLVVPNVPGYDNPLSITLKDGVVVPNSVGLEVNINGNIPELRSDQFIDKVSSKGVILQVPGLSGGKL